jgi:hypothetical protein
MSLISTSIQNVLLILKNIKALCNRVYTNSKIMKIPDFSRFFPDQNKKFQAKLNTT